MFLRPRHLYLTLLPLWLLPVALAGCGGGGGGGEGTDAAPPLQQRVDAATLTAQTADLCTAIAPFYWEIGDTSGALVSGTEGEGPLANTVMSVASASKWMYAAFVVQQRGSAASVDLPFLRFTSGHSNMNPSGCDLNPLLGAPRQTLDECLAEPGTGSVSGGSTQGAQNQDTVGRYFYNSGHMTVHASAHMGLGGLTTNGIAEVIGPVLAQGTPFSTFRYARTDLAGGVVSTPADYAQFLRGVLSGRLLMGGLLGRDAVCSNPATCASADYSPINGTPDEPVSAESWHYARGHWVEDDPTLQPDGTRLGDGAFSSPGAFGFYPWIDAGRQFYGVVARQSFTNGAAFASVECGRGVRKAFLTGVPQLAAPVQPAD